MRTRYDGIRAALLDAFGEAAAKEGIPPMAGVRIWDAISPLIDAAALPVQDDAAALAPTTAHACPDCGDVHLPPSEASAPADRITYCRTCGKTRFVEWLHRDCEVES